jgi:hypothetical protein
MKESLRESPAILVKKIAAHVRETSYVSLGFFPEKSVSDLMNGSVEL